MTELHRNKIYCGNSDILPLGYTKFGSLYECLRKGYGICKYTGHQGEKSNQMNFSNRPKTYCGTKSFLPEGYTNFATRNQCLRKGFGICQYSKINKKQFHHIFFQKYKDSYKTRNQWNTILQNLSHYQRQIIRNHLLFNETLISGLYQISLIS